MKKFAFLLSLVFVTGLAYAQETKQAEPTKPAEKAAPAKHAEKAPAAKTHEVVAEVVSFDANAKTLTVKGEKENMTVPVDEKALASVKALKAGEKATLICRDNEKGEHVAIAGVKHAAKAHEAAEKK
jgi:redox-sensitive bicupin YhaK (pirin superfamily)